MGDAPTTNVYVIYYSMYGHILKMAQEVVKGLESVPGVKAHLFQVPETLPETVLEKMHAPPKDASVPVIDVHTLDQADGFVFGFPTRYGMMCAQFKAFLDATGQHWQKGSLIGKPVSMFTSTATQGGGQEVTIMTALTQIAAHGMIYVPIGYSYGKHQFDISTVHGGSPWGAGTYAGGDGSRQPSAEELALAEHQGKYFAGKAKLLSAIH
jgi:NAD(P)H dehydrogenase (quinone)